MAIFTKTRIWKWSVAALLVIFYVLTSPQNHTEAEDAYEFARLVEQGSFSEQAGVNRLLALPIFGVAYDVAQTMGYPGRAYPFMIFLSRLLGVGALFLFYHVASVIMGRSRAIVSTVALAVSYGFWRYVNEAETYILAIFLVLCTWFLVVKGRFWWAIAISALGVLVHLLNVVPLLVVIPLYYALAKNWKKAVLHGGGSGLLVVVGYALCFHWLDWGELGAKHHSVESGMTLDNLLRGGVAFGQNVVSGNFLFGFEAFRVQLAELFPSRVLEEEFFMGSSMAGWIPWAGLGTLGLVAISFFCSVRWKSLIKAEVVTPFWIASLAWLILLASMVIRTEAGSPELWIVALVPFWFVIGWILRPRVVYFAVGALFAHNLVAGLLPVMSEDSDYHVAKGKWLVEHATAQDIVLTSYEPVLIFYMNYYCSAHLVSSADHDVNELNRILGDSPGQVYAFYNFFEPLSAMQGRYPELYDRMLARGSGFETEFELVREDAFGGIYAMKSEDGK